MAQAARKSSQGDTEKVQNIARKAMEPFVVSLLPSVVTELTEFCRSNTQTTIDFIEVASSIAQELNEETTQAGNRALAECTSISKDAFGCRTINDVIELQNRLVKLGMEHFFSEGSKLMIKSFDCCTTMFKPLQDHAAQSINSANVKHINKMKQIFDEMTKGNASAVILKQAATIQVKSK